MNHPFAAQVNSCADATAAESPFWGMCDGNPMDDGSCQDDWEAYVECIYDEGMELAFGLDCGFTCDVVEESVAGSMTVSGTTLAVAESQEPVYEEAIAASAGNGVVKADVTATFAEARRRRLSTEIVVSYTIATDSATTDSIVATMASLTATDMDAALTTAALAVSETWDGTTESVTAPEEVDDDLDGAATLGLAGVAAALAAAVAAL